MAAILSILRDCFRHGAVDHGVIDGLILMDKPIAQPSAFGNGQGEGHRQHACLRRCEKGIIVVLGRRA